MVLEVLKTSQIGPLALKLICFFGHSPLSTAFSVELGLEGGGLGDDALDGAMISIKGGRTMAGQSFKASSFMDPSIFKI